MKVSDYISKYIEAKGINFVFELSGGMITHLLDSLHLKTAINIVTMHHEQGASFAADAYGRITGLPGVALATSGPGATNLLTGIGSCYFDSVPALFITGQVNRHEQRGDRPIRQLGFQETDIVAMAEPITKKAYRVTDAKDIPQILAEAFRIAMHGRPGPVLIDLPMDIQRENIDRDPILDAVSIMTPLEEVYPENEILEQLGEAIKSSQKPLLLVGRGVPASFSEKELSVFLSITKLPLVTSLLALDAVSTDHANRIGFIGSYGNRWANTALGECDLLIVLGSRLDIRQTGADVRFFENRKIFHIDCELGEINNRIKGCLPIIADVKNFLKTFNAKFDGAIFDNNLEWFSYIHKLKEKWPDTAELSGDGINPNIFIHSLSVRSLNAKAFLADVGSHQMWAAQSLELYNRQRFLTSGGMGAMGFALPAAIGASLALERGAIVTIIGDGCMQINIQELQTIVRNKLPVKIIVLNNKSLGMITQFQQSYFESRFQSTYWGYSAPDFEKIAEAYGISAKTIHHSVEIENAIDWLWNETNVEQPLLLQVMIEPLTNTFPKIAFGRPLTEMEPFVKPIEMEST